jgi:hypothetical protein
MASSGLVDVRRAEGVVEPDGLRRRAPRDRLGEVVGDGLQPLVQLMQVAGSSGARTSIDSATAAQSDASPSR